MATINAADHGNGNRPPNLSLLAMYDDLSRGANQIRFSEIPHIINLLKSLEEARKKWSQALMDLRDRDALILKLQTDAHNANMRIQSLRMAFSREVKAKEQLLKEHNDLKRKMDALRQLVLEQDCDQVPTVANRSQLKTLLDKIDKMEPEQDDSNDGLLFDKSDDSIDDYDVKKPKIAKINTDNGNTPEKQSPKTEMRLVSNAVLNEKIDTIAESNEEESVFNTAFTAETGMEKLSSPSKTSTTTIVSRNRRASINWQSRLNLLRLHSKLEPDRLDSRPHKFQEKKAVFTQICTVCEKNIGFCSSYSVCYDCRGVVHNRCQNMLPRPCIPYVSGDGIRKMISIGSGIGQRGGKFLNIADFTDVNCRPCVPALMIHCCNEIDRRIQLTMKSSKKPNDSPLVGLYRICSVERDVRELRNKILEAKKGIPNLKTIVDVHLICGVVKMFLRDLDNSLITTPLWHDFARAADHVVSTKPKRLDDNFDMERPDSGVDDQSHFSTESDEDTPLQVLKEVILELPIANRDSLAFLMLHLKNVAKSEPVTKMTEPALANIFAPTVVGNSQFRQISSNSLMRENDKQVMIMNALFTIEESFWNGLLKDQNFVPFKRDRRETASSINTDAINNCSRLAKISSSNLKSLLSQNNQNEPKKQDSDQHTQKLTQKMVNNNLPNNFNGATYSKQSVQQLKKRGSIEYLRETLY